MNRIFAFGLLVCGASLTLLAAPVPDTTTGVVKDREAFIPQRKYTSLPEKVIGVLVSDVGPKMSHEGRGGPADAMGFSVDGSSYRWIYVPVKKPDAIITNLQVKTGEKGDGLQVYPLLNMANARTIKPSNIDVPYALVEVEVNDLKGAPADEAFVATKMTRLDGTKEYPLDVTKAVAEAKKKYAEWKEEQKNKLDEAFLESQKKAIKQGKPTGPREAQELLYVTWQRDTKRLSVRFRTTITDGEYKYTPGGAVEGDPVPLPLPPPPAKKLPPPPGLAAFPPPPPRDLPRVRYGMSFGLEFGIAYEFNPSGKIEKVLTLPAQSFSKELPPPPVGLDRPRRPFELPPPPRP